MTTASTNAILAYRWLHEVWNKRDEQLLSRLMSPDVVGEAEGGVLVGRDAFVANVYRVLLDTFPDIQLEVVGTVAEGDEVMLRWRAQGTHRGAALGPAPTGLSVRFRGMTWLKIRDNQIVEGCDSWNQSGLLQALQTKESVGSVQIVQGQQPQNSAP
jgi:steroid delta-isomerase-like uncharacterized protein